MEVEKAYPRGGLCGGPTLRHIESSFNLSQRFANLGFHHLVCYFLSVVVAQRMLDYHCKCLVGEIVYNYIIIHDCVCVLLYYIIFYELQLLRTYVAGKGCEDGKQ